MLEPNNWSAEGATAPPRAPIPAPTGPNGEPATAPSLALANVAAILGACSVIAKGI